MRVFSINLIICCSRYITRQWLLIAYYWQIRPPAKSRVLLLSVWESDWTDILQSIVNLEVTRLTAGVCFTLSPVFNLPFRVPVKLILSAPADFICPGVMEFRRWSPENFPNRPDIVYIYEERSRYWFPWLNIVSFPCQYYWLCYLQKHQAQACKVFLGNKENQ